MQTLTMNDRMIARINERFHFETFGPEVEGPEGVEIYDKEVDEIIADGLPSEEFARGFAASILHTEDTAKEWITPLPIDMAA